MIKKILRHLHGLFREHIQKPLTRSPHWSATRKAFLKTNATCAACNGTTKLNVHHKEPFHLDPALELDPKNLITLCMGSLECHLLIGHGDDFKAYNPNVAEDAATVLRDASQRDAIILKAKQNRKYV
jgi:hypothetical protein